MKFLLSTCSILLMSSQVFAGGIPVVDAKAVAKQVESCAKSADKESQECVKAFKAAEQIKSVYLNDNTKASD